MEEKVLPAAGRLCSLLLLGAFAVSLLLVLALGALQYREISGVLDEQYGPRTAQSYIAAKVRRHDHADGVALGSLGGCGALVLREEIEGWDYVTYIYCYDNGLYELFCEAGSGLLPEDGERLLDLDSLSFDLADGLLRVTCTDGGERYETCLALRAEGGAA